MWANSTRNAALIHMQDKLHTMVIDIINTIVICTNVHDCSVQLYICCLSQCMHLCIVYIYVSSHIPMYYIGYMGVYTMCHSYVVSMPLAYHFSTQWASSMTRVTRLFWYISLLKFSLKLRSKTSIQNLETPSGTHHAAYPALQNNPLRGVLYIWGLYWKTWPLGRPIKVFNGDTTITMLWCGGASTQKIEQERKETVAEWLFSTSWEENEHIFAAHKVDDSLALFSCQTLIAQATWSVCQRWLNFWSRVCH